MPSLLLLLVAAAAVATQGEGLRSTTPMTHIAFSGGGIRAEFGSVLTGCAIKRWAASSGKASKSASRPGVSGLGITEVVGLSGGAWGAAMLANLPHQKSVDDVCAEVDRVVKESKKGGAGWAQFTQYHKKCRQTKCEGKTCTKDGAKKTEEILPCHVGWKQDLQKSVFANTKTLKFKGNMFGPEVKTSFLLNTCAFDKGLSRHTGSCVVSDGAHGQLGLKCTSFNERWKGHRKAQTLSISAEVGTGKCSVHTESDEKGMPVGTGVGDDIWDWLSFASAAYAEVKQVIKQNTKGVAKFLGDFVLSPGAHRNTPSVVCESSAGAAGMTGGKNKVTTNFCDAGPERCNQPIT